jgi:hypothetical protein
METNEPLFTKKKKTYSKENVNVKLNDAPLL